MVGRGKCVFRTRDEARAEAKKKLWGSPTARVIIYAVLGEVDEFAWPPNAENEVTRLRVVAPSPVKYVETVRHDQQRVVEIVEEQMIHG